MADHTPTPIARLGAVLALALPLVTVALLGWHSLSDRDVWFHARAGSDLLADGHFLKTNHYSYTAPDEPWINHEWLFQVVVAATAPATPPAADAAITAWTLLRTLLALGLVVVLAGSRVPELPRREPPGRSLLVAGSLLAALALLWTRLTLRPELVSYILFVVHLTAVEATLAAPAEYPGWRCWLDPRRPPGRATLVTILWAQVHGFASLVLPVWILVAAPALVTANRRGTDRPALLRRAGSGLGLAIVALALTPNGIAGLVYPLRALAQFGGEQPDLRRLISELVPLLQTRDALGATLALFRISLVWAALWILAQWGRVPVHRILLAVLAAAAALQAQRGLGLYAVTFALLHTGTSWPLRTPFLPERHRRRAGKAAAIVVAAAALAACAVWWPAVMSDRFYLGEGVVRRFGSGLTPAHTPAGVLMDLRDSGARTVLANVDAAGAVLALGGPAVFIDGRTEAYPPALWRDYAALRDGGDGARAVLARWRPEAVCLAYASGAFTRLTSLFLADPGWSLASIDGAAALFLPAGEYPRTDPDATGAWLLTVAEESGRSSARRADLCLAAARTFQLTGARAKALAALRRGATIRPDHPQVQHNLGNALLEAGDLAAAGTAFAAAFAANSRQAGSALNAGVCCFRLGRARDAEAWLARSIAVDPRSFPAWMNLAAVRQHLGDSAGARQALTRAAELRPDDPQLRARLRGS